MNVELNGWIGARDDSGFGGMIDVGAIARGHEHNDVVDGNHAKLFEFSAVVTYEYPCESKLTASGTIGLDIEGGEVKELEGTVTVYCPGMVGRRRLTLNVYGYRVRCIRIQGQIRTDIGSNLCGYRVRCGGAG